MQENGHLNKHQAMIAVAISVALSGVLILLAVFFACRRSSRPGFRRDVRPVAEGEEATPLQTGINLLCVLYRKFR